MRVQFLGWEDPLEKEMAPHSIFLLVNPVDRGAWLAAVHGVTEELDMTITEKQQKWYMSRWFFFSSAWTLKGVSATVSEIRCGLECRAFIQSQMNTVLLPLIVCCESSCQRDSVKIKSGNISFWSKSTCSSQSVGSVAVVHGLNCSEAGGIFPDQGPNPCLLHWQVDSLPMSHQGFNFLFHLAHGEDRVPKRRAVLANVTQPRSWASQLLWNCMWSRRQNTEDLFISLVPGGVFGELCPLAITSSSHCLCFPHTDPVSVSWVFHPPPPPAKVWNPIPS